MERTTAEAEPEKGASSRNQRNPTRDSGGSQPQRGTAARLHRAVGNQGLQALRDRGYLQTKLEVSQPGDPGEREADRVAETVMRKSEPAGGQTETTTDSPSFSSHRRLLPSSGRPLDANTREFFEPRFGREFGGVRVHTGPEAASTAKQWGARAFTAGSHIVFGAGEYRPSRPSGRRLLAHELAHVTQGGRTIRRNPLTVEEIDKMLAENERQARQQDLSSQAMSALMETRDRLLRLRSQLTSGEFDVDYSLATSGGSRQQSTGGAAVTPDQRADFYRRAEAFSTGLDRLGRVLDHVRGEVVREQSEWYVFSDRRFTRPVVERVLNEASPFAGQASTFVAQKGHIDPAVARRLREKVRAYESKLAALRAVKPEPIGGAEATGRRFVGGVKGAGGAFLGFLRLGLIDSWGQFVFEGSEQRVREAQDGLASLITKIDQEGFGPTVSDVVGSGVEGLERAERMGQHTAAAEQFGASAFDLYFAGRGLVSMGQGGVKLTRTASALREAGHAAPWRGALGMAGRELITFRGVGVHGRSGFWGSQYRMGGSGQGPRGSAESGEGRTSGSGGGRSGPPERGSGGGGEGGGGDSQRVLVVGAETPEEFAYARSVAGRGHDVRVVNPKVTSEARAHMQRGGRFTAERVEDLPRQPSFDLIREDFPFPQGRAFSPSETFAAERVARLAPGGRWVLLTESGEFAHTLRAVASRMQVRITVREYSRFPEFHEATPASSWPRDPTRYLVVFEKPPAPGQ